MRFLEKIFVVALLFCLCVAMKPLQHVAPHDMGMDEVRLSAVDVPIRKAITEHLIPGAVLAVVRGDKLAYFKAYGNKQVFPDTVPMTPGAVFDLASVSKAISTTTCVMQLVERGKMALDDRVDKFLPNFKNYSAPSLNTKPIRVVDLLTHTSGLPPYVGIVTLRDQYGIADKKALADYICTCPRQFEPRTKFAYSCLNFITLQLIIEKVSGKSLRCFAHENIFLPLGMTHTDYCPSDTLKLYCVPTEMQSDSTVFCGVVHDPLARIPNNGVSGNAGLFSSAADLAVFSVMLLNGGEYGGKRILQAATVQQMCSIPVWGKDFGRALGWDVSSAYASANGDFGKQAIVHTGYTGTSVVIDFETKTAVILLTNRVHPKDKGSIVKLRKAVAECVHHSILQKSLK
ncbi:MAG: class A beta-lactamase-related serine hydrolase [Sphingobacteriia bacterium]|nr:class A beta-lactamase-related serine hydrolase [Sphingobacteriia bacterium]